MCFGCISRCLMANSDNIRQAKGARDKNLTFIENVNLFVTALLAVFSLIHLIIGVKFVNEDIISKGESMDHVQRYATAFIVLSCLGTVAFTITSYCITKRCCTSKLWLPCYGILLVALALPPLFAEGTAMFELSRYDSEEIHRYCSMSQEEVADDAGKVVAAFMEFAHRFDELSDGLLDRNMCTSTCPCYSYAGMVNASEPLPEQIYKGLSESTLNNH